jgi:hypothetical protein
VHFDERGVHLSEPLLQLRGVLTGVPTEVPVTREDRYGRRPGEII